MPLAGVGRPQRLEALRAIAESAHEVHMLDEREGRQAVNDLHGIAVPVGEDPPIGFVVQGTPSPTRWSSAISRSSRTRRTSR